jgi:beta-glucanase (GH16 family)
MRREDPVDDGELGNRGMVTRLHRWRCRWLALLRPEIPESLRRGRSSLSLGRFATKPHAHIWNDEFETDGLVDEAKWKYDTFRNPVGWYNGELQYYSSRRPENAVVDDGKLLITARIETLNNLPDYGGQKYTSARMITQDRQAWTYGYFDIRAKLPCGGGTWPAIWTLGTTRGEWPLNGEIDIMEYVGNDPNWVSGFVHTPSGYAGGGQGRRTILEDACQDFHNFQMLWTEDKLEFAVDGKKYY